MCCCLPPYPAHLLLWLQQRGRPLLQPGGHRGPSGAQVGGQPALAPQTIEVEAPVVCGFPGECGRPSSAGEGCLQEAPPSAAPWGFHRRSGTVQLKGKAAASRVCRCHRGAITGLAASPDGSLLFSSCSRGSLAQYHSGAPRCRILRVAGQAPRPNPSPALASQPSPGQVPAGVGVRGAPDRGTAFHSRTTEIPRAKCGFRSHQPPEIEGQ